MSRNQGREDFETLRKRDVLNYRTRAAEESFYSMGNFKPTLGIRRALSSINEWLDEFLDADNDPRARARLERTKASKAADFDELLRELRKVAPVPTKKVLQRIAPEEVSIPVRLDGGPDYADATSFFGETWRFLIWELAEEMVEKAGREPKSRAASA